MTWGIPTPVFLQIHVALSLIGILTGFMALFGMLTGRLLAGWTAIFMATTFLTGVTGFPLPPFGLDPPRVVGVMLLCLLVAACAGLYLFSLGGRWRAAYVICAVASLYLNVFVAIAQSFQKIPALRALAPTQSEPPFAVVQVVVLVIFGVLGFVAWRRFPSSAATTASLA
jgi:hypothetical protein